MSAFAQIVRHSVLVIVAAVMAVPAWAVGPSFSTLVTTAFDPPAVVYYFADPGESNPNLFSPSTPTYDGGDPLQPPGPVTILSDNGFVNHPGSLGHNFSTAFTSTGSTGNQVTALVSPGYAGVVFILGSISGATTSLNIDVYTTLGQDTYTDVAISRAIFPLSPPISTDQYGFIGFTSPGLITKVVFTQNAPSGAEDFVMAAVQVSAVPEPTTPLMLMVGLGLIGMVVRRKNA